MKHKKNLQGKRKPSHPLKPHHPSKITKPSSSKTKNNGHGGAKPKTSSSSAYSTRPIIPFTPTSTLLLIGEGDFSFTNSLVSSTPPHISPSTVITTTTNDTEAVTCEKYPHAEETISSLKSSGHKIHFSLDITKKLPKSIASQKYNCIIFNFPHVGGLSTHLDRQIRSNQELILSFLKASVPLLSPDGGIDDGSGNIVITLFSGKPYDDWNVKELAKSVGLECVRSFKFDATIYEGYKHVRTIGFREREGDWKGEERGARSYIFAVKDDGRKKKSRKKGGDKNGGNNSKTKGKDFDDDDDDDE
ncbi:hypothetical protein TWF730_005855 [Orbilia blumenaviensis]|uniref:25S rRNA (uridine-N(3))-methyltransferase BMT5-like domain-containing protein n=1 Tax=Orbilia blumenaviensis TaxID=1796055 RepID=A0AAV9VLQ3_9PEZI